MPVYAKHCQICGDNFVTRNPLVHRCAECREPPRIIKPIVIPKIEPNKRVDPIDQKIKDKKQYLKRTYGITLAQYNKMYKDQKGKCKVCKRHVERLYVDHDHTTGEVRALLCPACNYAYGMLCENPKYIEGLLQYAIRHWHSYKRFGH